jgi:hypothetical protein
LHLLLPPGDCRNLLLLLTQTFLCHLLPVLAPLLLLLQPGDCRNLVLLTQNSLGCLVPVLEPLLLPQRLLLQPGDWHNLLLLTQTPSSATYCMCLHCCCCYCRQVIGACVENAPAGTFQRTELQPPLAGAAAEYGDVRMFYNAR